MLHVPASSAVSVKVHPLYWVAYPPASIDKPAIGSDRKGRTGRSSSSSDAFVRCSPSFECVSRGLVQLHRRCSNDPSEAFDTAAHLTMSTLNGSIDALKAPASCCGATGGSGVSPMTHRSRSDVGFAVPAQRANRTRADLAAGDSNDPFRTVAVCAAASIAANHRRRFRFTHRSAHHFCYSDPRCAPRLRRA